MFLSQNFNNCQHFGQGLKGPTVAAKEYRSWKKLPAEMEKAYKIAHAKLWVWKISTKTCAKNAQNCAKLAKMPKIAHKKRQNPLMKRMKKLKLAQLWKISTNGVAAAAIFFHLWLPVGWQIF